MDKVILFNGIEYPLQFNFLVFANWEKQTGKKISELSSLSQDSGAVEAVDALTLLFFAVQDACEEKGIEFSVKLTQFIRGVKPEEIGQFMSKISLGGDEENKRQPKAPKK
tara:strand:- start:635 stop:964 length:330 start_codon:yes stop_codon:yes gene_type:complete